MLKSRLKNLILRWLALGDDERIAYLLDEVSELRSQVRLLSAARDASGDTKSQTKDSFSYQWDELSEGSHLVGDPKFDREMFDLISKYTELPKEWFARKRVLDAGCGNGRWSFAFDKLGAHVTAFDQSAAGVKNLRKLTGPGSNVKIQQADILKPLQFEPNFDLVWSYGVCHHTGNTKLAIHNVARMVPSGGKLFLMIYGEPSKPGEFNEINRYVKLRRDSAFMSFDEKTKYLESLFPKEQVHGYFDAISPTINDLYRYDEIKSWLLDLGFRNIRTTIPSRNHHIMAER
jgi:SAM-dependent methyltransferase